MKAQEIQENEILKEYYSFLYDLASKKNYLHASQLTQEERQYCEKLLSRCKTKIQSKELYLPLMKNILRSHYSSASG
jgi:5-bromo-4-chloroindolyl phosphate hydrolysis protein